MRWKSIIKNIKQNITNWIHNVIVKASIVINVITIVNKNEQNSKYIVINNWFLQSIALWTTSSNTMTTTNETIQSAQHEKKLKKNSCNG